MIVCAIGDAHGALDRMYDDAMMLAHRCNVRIEHVLHVGDLGVWPDHATLDKATHRRGIPGDFHRWLARGISAPIETTFIMGNHEDHVWLSTREHTDVLPRLRYLPNGSIRTIASVSDALTIGGIGGCYGPSSYMKRKASDDPPKLRHFTREEIDRLIACDRGIDIMLFHDSPAGIVFNGMRGRYVSPTLGLNDVLAALSPIVCFFGHHHTRVDAMIKGVRCIGLNKVGCSGSVMIVDVNNASQTFEIVGEL